MNKFRSGDQVECRVVLKPIAAQIEVQSFRGGRRIVSAAIAARDDGCLAIELIVDPKAMTREHRDIVLPKLDPSIGQYLDTTA